MFKFLAKIWPKNGHVPGASLEAKLGDVIRAEVKPLQDDITILRSDVRGVNDKLDKHIQWHLEQRNGPR